MSKESFLLAVKSCIDKKGWDLASSLGISCVDLDDSTKTGELFASKESAIVLEYNTLTQDPIDPLYRGSLHIGARTVQDPANYEILNLVGKVETLFPVYQRMEIRSAAGTVEGSVEGVLIPLSVDVTTQQYALLSGVRLVMVEFKAIRFST